MKQELIEFVEFLDYEYKIFVPSWMIEAYLQTKVCPECNGNLDSEGKCFCYE